MAQGLQCWDALGRLAVDLTDYNLRFLGVFSARFTPGVASINVAVSGATASGTLGIITASDNASVNEFFCRAYDGGINILYLPTGGTYNTTLTIEVYNFQ